MRRTFLGCCASDHSPTHHEHEGDYKKAQPFWILDCRFSIVGNRTGHFLRRNCIHAFVLLRFNRKSKTPPPPPPPPIVLNECEGCCFI